MKKMYILLLAGLFCINISAQERRQVFRSTAERTDSVQAKPTDAGPNLQPHTAGTYAQPIIDRHLPAAQTTATDTLHLPTMNAYGQVLPFRWYPYGWLGWYNWDLHPGLNVNLGASVFAFLGKNAPRGAGFTQNLSAMYAMPLTKNLSLAVGGYLNNIIWSRTSYRDAGLTAALGYRFDEHWEAYLYGQKSIVQTRFTPLPLYDMGNLGDRIGAAVKYNFTPSFSVQLSVERGWMPKQDSRYFDQYNYPVPER